MAGAGRVTAAFGDWLTTGNSNSVSGELCSHNSIPTWRLNHVDRSTNRYFVFYP